MTSSPNPAASLPADTAIPFAHLISRLDCFEQKVDVWLAKRRQHTYAPLPAADSSETPVEPLDAGLQRTLARGVA